RPTVARPSGRNATTRRNSPPRKYVQNDGNRSDRLVSAHDTASDPITGPSSVARPPIATPTRNAMDGTTPTSAGEMIPTTGANSAPPIAANSAATVYARTLTSAGS